MCPMIAPALVFKYIKCRKQNKAKTGKTKMVKLTKKGTLLGSLQNKSTHLKNQINLVNAILSYKAREYIFCYINHHPFLMFYHF